MLMDLRDRLRVPLMLAPALAVVFFLYLGGLVLALSQSFGYMPVVGKYDFSFDAYVNVFTDPRFLSGLALTCWIGFSVAFLSMVLAVICALVLRQTLPGKKLISFIFQFNIPIPHIVGVVAMMFVLSQSGLISRITYALGLTQGTTDFPALIYDKYGIASIAEFLWKAVPFTGVIVLAVLQSLGEDYEDLARTLGASRWQRFRYVILPFIMPGLLRSSILVFAFAFGNFEIPWLLGARYPTPLPVLAWEYYHDIDLGNRREAMAISMVIAVLVTVLVWLYMKITEKYIRSD
jgi:putative spermidine/putrescine transport system permease protein